MILALDVGNTNITCGVFDGDRIKASFRITTKMPRTSDEYGMLLSTLLERNQKGAIGDATSLWHTVDPTYDEIIAAIDAFDFTGYEEFVFCGYGEPTCALDILEKTAKYVKEKYKLPIRVNTNGLGNLYHGRDIVPELAEYIDSFSISLNAANAEEYNKVTRPSFDNAYEAMLDFAEECNRMIKHTQLSIVDVLPEEDIKACQQIADERGIHLKIRHFSN